MPRRPSDYTAQMQAAEQRRRQRAEERRKEEEEEIQQIRARQGAAYGEVVRTVGTCLDIDQLAGLLLEAGQRVGANPELEKEWRLRGQAFFRGPDDKGSRSGKSGNKTTGNGGAGNGKPGEIRPGQAGAVASPGAEPQLDRAVAARTPDLLGGLAPGQASPGAAAQS